MTAPKLPEPVAILADQLAELPGAVAVALGGSRAAGTQRPDSDWDLGLHHLPVGELAVAHAITGSPPRPQYPLAPR
jgi:hypothetical protein